jgi:hypothetical protein
LYLEVFCGVIVVLIAILKRLFVNRNDKQIIEVSNNDNSQINSKAGGSVPVVEEVTYECSDEHEIEKNWENQYIQSQAMSTKKPIFKKWWFWLIIAVAVITVVIGVIGASTTRDRFSISNSKTKTTSVKVGEIIVDYPQDWTLENQENQIFSLKFGKNTNSSFIIQQFNSYELSNTAFGLQSFYAGMFGSIPNSGDIKISKFTSAKFVVGLKGEYSRVLNGEHVQFQDIVFVYDNYLYAVGFGIDEEDVHNFQNEIDAVFDSVATANGEKVPLIGDIDPNFDYFK